MLHIDAKSLRDQGDRLFSAKAALDSRNQDIAENFYLERATFTAPKSLGDDFGEHLMTGYPVMVRRDLGDALGSMLRPRDRQWFHMRADREEVEDHEGKAWMEYATGVQRRSMYDRVSMFARATKECDQDYAAFGNGIISVEVNRRVPALIYRCWHPRDVAWTEDSYGQIGAVHRNWKPTARELCYFFPKTVHHKVEELKDKDPYREVRVRQVVIKAEDYDWKKSRHPWVNLFLDVENDHILEEVGSWTRRFVIPRWMTVSGNQYGYSPAVTIALPDARLIQAMTLTMLDAGERAANPPMIGVSEAIRGDLQLFPNGFTAIDAEYDERLGEVLRPIAQDSRALPFGMDMLDRQAAMLREAFYLNSLSLPPQDVEMTAFETGQRVQEYIRKALPLFEPIEENYNGELCEMTFETLLRENAFGPVDNIPDSIRGREIRFSFESPLAEMIDRAKGQTFLESKAMVAEAAAMDPTAPMIMDFGETLRDVLDGIGAPKKWLRSPQQVQAAQKAEAAKQEQAQMLQAAQQGSDVAETVSRTAQNLGLNREAMI